MDITTKAIAVRSTDYKENDKMILLYSLEYGKISVHARGIRKAAAKLKFAADPFCFGTYFLAENGGRYTLKTCEQIESFYALREDIVSFYGASVAAECLMNLTEDGQSDAEIFVETLKTLEALTVGAEPMTAVLRFLLRFLKLSGYELNFERCSLCGEKVTGKAYIDMLRGGAVCDKCRNAESAAVSLRTVGLCKLISDIPVEKLSGLNFTGEMKKEALGVMESYITRSFVRLKSLSEFIKLS